VAGVAEHHPLVARADLVEVLARAGALLERLVDAHRDVGRLLVDRGDDAARAAVEPVRLPVVADRADRVAHDARDVDVGARADLAGDDDETGGRHRLARDPARRVLLEDGVEDGVADLVAHLVGVTLGHRLRRERERIHGFSLCGSVIDAHAPRSCWRDRSPSRRCTLSKMTLARSSFVSSGSSSTAPLGSRSSARFVSTSNPASAALTSLATMRSTRFARSLSAACSRTRSVSAAKPTSTWPVLRSPSAARMSGVGSRTTSGRPSRFFSFSAATAFGRKSATAAAITTTSTSA